MTSSPAHSTATVNACKLCAPLGASLAIRGIEGAVPLLHGSQGCATYIRRYMISHYKEPIDIASSSFDESAAVFGGEKNLLAAVGNIESKYHPSLIGIATTCLAETMGEDVGLYLKNARRSRGKNGCPVFQVSTPSYAGTHVDGYHATVLALVEAFAAFTKRDTHLAILPGMLSPADIRHLKSILKDFDLEGDTVPDYSDTLDGPVWTEYEPIPKGGTPLSSLRRLGDASNVLELSLLIRPELSAAALLCAEFGVKKHSLPAPIGVAASDRFFDALSQISGRPIPTVHQAERGRLLDALVDGHKSIFGKRAAVYGDPDMVSGLAVFLSEIGIHPVIAATGTPSGRMQAFFEDAVEDETYRPNFVLETADFESIEETVKTQNIDILIGHSKGYGMSRRLGIPLVRVGFPIHDRIGGARILHVGYRGAQQLYDTIANTLISQRQDSDDIGYAYM